MDETTTTSAPPPVPPLLKPPILPPPPHTDGALIDVPVQSHNLPPNSGKLTKNVDVLSVPPPPKPEEPATISLAPDDVVDAFYEDTWRKGVVKQLVDGTERFAVSFDDKSDELVEFQLDDLKLHWDCVDGTWTRSANKAAVASMYDVGGKIEVSRDSARPHNSWFTATVVGPMKYGSLTVEYMVKVGVQTQTCRAAVDRAGVRLCPPTLYVKRFVLWEKVDVYWDCGWLSGVITKVLADYRYLVFVEQLKKAKVFQKHLLRTHMEYKRGKWYISSQDSTISERGDSSERNSERLISFQTPPEGSVDASKRNTTEVVMLDAEEIIMGTRKIAPALGKNNENHSETAMQYSGGISVSPASQQSLPNDKANFSHDLVGNILVNPSYQQSLLPDRAGSEWTTGLSVIPNGQRNLSFGIASSSNDSADKMLIFSGGKQTLLSDKANGLPESISAIRKRNKKLLREQTLLSDKANGLPESLSDIRKRTKKLIPSATKPRAIAPKLRAIAPKLRAIAPKLTAIAPAVEKNNDKQHETNVLSSYDSVGKDLMNENGQPCFPSDKANLLWKSIETIMESGQKIKVIATDINEKNEKQPETVVQPSYDSVDEILVNASGQQSSPFDKDNTLLKTIENTTKSSEKHVTVAPATEEDKEIQPDSTVQSSDDSPLKTIETTMKNSREHRTVAPATEDNCETQPESAVQFSHDSLFKTIETTTGCSLKHKTSAPITEEDDVTQPETAVQLSKDSLLKIIETTTESSQNHKTIGPATEETQPETAVHLSNDSLLGPAAGISQKHKTIAPATEENNETEPDLESFNDPFDKANPLWRLIETITESCHNLEAVEPVTEKNGKRPETVCGQRSLPFDKASSSYTRVDKNLANKSGKRSLRLDEVFNKSQLRLHMKSKGGKWVISSQDGTPSETGGSSAERNTGRRMGNLQTAAKGLLINRSSLQIDKASSSRNPVNKNLVNQSRQRSFPADKGSSFRSPVVNILVPGKEPFEKASPIWKAIEDMDVFKRLPQKPHFRPLQQCQKSSREAKAIGLMVNFSNVVKRVSELQFTDSKSVTSDILTTLTELGTHGFDVTGVLDCVINFLSMKDKWEKFANDAKTLDEQISARSDVRHRIETEISQVKKKMRKLNEELSHVQSAKEREDGEIAFLQARLVEAKESMQNVEDELHDT